MSARAQHDVVSCGPDRALVGRLAGSADSTDRRRLCIASDRWTTVHLLRSTFCVGPGRVDRMVGLRAEAGLPLSYDDYDAFSPTWLQLELRASSVTISWPLGDGRRLLPVSFELPSRPGRLLREREGLRDDHGRPVRFPRAYPSVSRGHKDG